MFVKDMVTITNDYININGMELSRDKINEKIVQGEENPHVISYGIDYEELEQIQKNIFKYYNNGHVYEDNNLEYYEEIIIFKVNDNGDIDII